LNPTSFERINTHLASPSNISTTITTAAAYDDKLFNYQRNNVRNTQANKWQNGKVGNGGDPNSYVHEDSSKKKIVRTCTNTTLCAEGKSKKVTQPPNVTQQQSFSTLSRKCNERRGNKRNEHERNTAHTQTQYDSKTLASDGMVATKQISHNQGSNENAAKTFVLDFYRENRHDDVEDKYRLFNYGGAIKNRGNEHLNAMHVKSSSSSDDSFGGNKNLTSPATTISTELYHRDLSGNSQMPSSLSLSYVQSQQQQAKSSVTLTNKILDSNASSAGVMISQEVSYDPCNSRAPHFCQDFDYQLKENVINDAAGSMDHNNKNDNDIKCFVDVNNIENDRNRVNVVECNHVVISMPKEIDHVVKDESENFIDAKYFQSADKSSSEITDEPQIIKAENVIITSAIENISMATSVANEALGKTKYANEILTLREKRRQDRRDRRLARARANDATLASATNEILPDIINNHMQPPPYADMPAPQQIVPSIVSTVPVEDNRYTFSLPLVRR
jgi:hypothetical protein